MVEDVNKEDTNKKDTSKEVTEKALDILQDSLREARKRQRTIYIRRDIRRRIR
jgi:hypothetical protein